MFHLRASYKPGYRVFIPVDSATQVHELFKHQSLWGGHDKTEAVEGITCFGYEFINIDDAAETIRLAVKLKTYLSVESK